MLKNNFVGYSSIKKEIIKTEDWEKAKQGDFNAGLRIIKSLWSDKKSQQLFDSIKGKDIILISQPSTTEKNILPFALACYLIKAINKFNSDLCSGKKTIIKVINGNKYFTPVHSKAAKDISRNKRVFYPRKFFPNDPESFIQKVQGKSVYITEDILNTGGSVKHFSQELRKMNCNVEGVVAMMGDKRLSLDQKTSDRLNLALQSKGYKFSVAEFGEITRAEAGGLIQLINGAKSTNAQHQLTQNLQRLRDQGTLEHPERDPERRYESRRESNSRNAVSDERVQADPHPSDTTGIRKDERLTTADKLRQKIAEKKAAHSKKRSR